MRGKSSEEWLSITLSAFFSLMCRCNQEIRAEGEYGDSDDGWRDESIGNMRGNNKVGNNRQRRDSEQRQRAGK